MSSEITILYSRNRYLLFLLLAIGLGVFAYLILIQKLVFTLRGSETIGYYFAWFILAISVIGIGAISLILVKHTPALILGDKELIYATPYGKRFPSVSYEEIQDVYIKKQLFFPYLIIVLKRPEAYLQKATGRTQRVAMKGHMKQFGAPLAIFAFILEGSSTSIQNKLKERAGLSSL